MDISKIRITRDKPFPGSEIELRLYRSVFIEAQTGLSSKFSKLFSDNGWSIPWVNGVYPFHHFHAEAHEALGCAAGWVIVQMGGPNGPEFRLEAGDAVLIPAGVAHKNIDSSADYRILGSYPHGQEPDLRRGNPQEWNEVLDKIAHVKLWKEDPVTGEMETDEITDS